MKILVVDLNKDYSDAIQDAAQVLKEGGVVVYPTDTVYGLGANACDPRAVERIFRIKSRPLEKPLPLIARNLTWVKGLAYISPKLEETLNRLWPGQTTVVLPRRLVIPDIITAGKPNVAVRIPDFLLTDKLLGYLGYPLTATSAIVSGHGEETANDSWKITSMFQDRTFKPDLILDAGVLPKSLPSTILDLTSNQPKILRIGPTKPDQLRKIMGLDIKLR